MGSETSTGDTGDTRRSSTPTTESKADGRPNIRRVGGKRAHMGWALQGVNEDDEPCVFIFYAKTRRAARNTAETHRAYCNGSVERAPEFDPWADESNHEPPSVAYLANGYSVACSWCEHRIYPTGYGVGVETATNGATGKVEPLGAWCEECDEETDPDSRFEALVMPAVWRGDRAWCSDLCMMNEHAEWAVVRQAKASMRARVLEMFPRARIASTSERTCWFNVPQSDLGGWDADLELGRDGDNYAIEVRSVTWADSQAIAAWLMANKSWAVETTVCGVIMDVNRIGVAAK